MNTIQFGEFEIEVGSATYERLSKQGALAGPMADSIDQSAMSTDAEAADAQAAVPARSSKSTKV